MMLLRIGENIQILNRRVRDAIDNRQPEYLQHLARAQVRQGAQVLDLNIGPRKRDGAEAMPWVIDAVHAVAKLPLSLDSINASAVEAGLRRCQELGVRAMINSTSADPDRLEAVMPLAAKYEADVIALTMGKNLPNTADERVELAVSVIMPRAIELGLDPEHIYFDPLVLTVNGCQPHAPETLNAIRFLKVVSDPAPKTIVGLSNISNSVPNENRSLINRTFLVMLLGAGLDAAILDPLDKAQNEVLRVIEEGDSSTPMNQLLLHIHAQSQASEPVDESMVDMSDPEQLAIWRTVQILENRIIYAHSYLQV
jgi:5-methyltetrahydrofolate corrinoid/iron sulfur protein methyltransferase